MLPRFGLGAESVLDEPESVRVEQRHARKIIRIFHSEEQVGLPNLLKNLVSGVEPHGNTRVRSGIVRPQRKVVWPGVEASDPVGVENVVIDLRQLLATVLGSRFRD